MCEVYEVYEVRTPPRHSQHTTWGEPVYNADGSSQHAIQCFMHQARLSRIRFVVCSKGRHTQ